MEINKKKFEGMMKYWGTYGLVIMVGFILLGLMGLMVVLGITLVAPFVIGAMIPSSNSSLKDKWSDLSGVQKGAMGTFLVLMLPFLGIILIWAMVMGVSYWIDIIIFVPIIFIALYLLNTKLRTSEERQSSFIGRLFGSKAIALVAVLIIVIVAVFAVYSYGSEYSEKNYNKDDGKFGDLDGDGDVDEDDAKLAEELLVTDPPAGANNTTADNDLPATIDLKLRIVDQWIADVEGEPELYTWWGDYLNDVNASFNDGELNSTIGAPLDDAYGLFNVKCSMEIYEYGEVINGSVSVTSETIIAYTDQFGFVEFKNLTWGNYTVYMEKTGYINSNVTVAITDAMLGLGDDRFEDSTATIPVDYTISMVSKATEIVVEYMAVPADILEIDPRIIMAVTEERIKVERNLVGKAGAYMSNCWKGLVSLGSEDDYQDVDYAYEVTYNYINSTYCTRVDTATIFVSAYYTSGIQIKDLELINRNDKYYDWSGLPRGTVGQSMWGLKNQMQTVYNSYFTALQSVMPALQSVTSGGGLKGALSGFVQGIQNLRDTFTFGNESMAVDLTEVWNLRENEITLVQANKADGTQTFVSQLPERNSLTNKLNATGEDTNRRSLMDMRQVRFMVWDADAGTTLTLQWKTTFDVLQGSFWVGIQPDGEYDSLKATGETETIITDVSITLFGQGVDTNVVETGHQNTGDYP